MSSLWPPKAAGQAPAASLRDRLAVQLAVVTAICLGAAFFITKGTQSLMPGPLASAHGAIENCSACHTKSGGSKLSWVHGLVAGDPLADSKACLTCHKMPDTALNAHGASGEVLEQSKERLTKVAARTRAPHSARAQSVAFPTDPVVARGLFCATCHQEHQGVNFKLSRISNEQCRSCHVVKFDSFDGRHPKFESYPFKRRTRIVFDHAGHFGKHYPEVAKKDPQRRIPDTCATCHNSRADKRVMAVAPFEQTCTSCHLDQIVGKERASGPKGIAFLALPGLDVHTLKQKNAPVGEWPEASEAGLTPFMKVMIGRDEPGRALIRTVDGLNLQDLAGASDDQIKAVTALVWEIKELFHALIKGKASDVLGNLNIASGAALSANLVADLTASIPRDVVVSAQQEWLPNLATEMSNRPATGIRKQSGLRKVITRSSLVPTASVMDLSRSSSPRVDETGTPRASSADGPTVLAAEDSGSGSGPIGERVPLPSGTPRSIRAREQEPENSDAASTARERGGDAGKAAEPEGSPAKDDSANAGPDGGRGAPASEEPPLGEAAEQTDDLLFPTEEELRAMKAGVQDTGKAAPPAGAAEKPDTANARPAGAATGTDAAAAAPRAQAAPVISIESDVDPESWAEYGGWYRQDYAIFYRPTGHKDKFIYSWLFLTGPQAPKGDASPAAAVFDVLTGKDAQGSCTKCHSVDDIPGKGRLVNFSPPSAANRQGRFTHFIHEPHFGLLENRVGNLENRGCLSCHNLEKGRPYLKSYEQGNPQEFASNFGEVKKDLCQSCHTSTMARQDCLLCHKYHVNGVVTPIISTKLPTE